MLALGRDGGSSELAVVGGDGSGGELDAIC